MKKANGLFLAGAVILGLSALISLVQVAGKMFGGTPFSVYGLVLFLVILMIVLIFVGRYRPLLAGIISAAGGIIFAIYYFFVPNNLVDAAPFLLVLCLPMAIGGLLFIESDWRTRRKAS